MPLSFAGERNLNELEKQGIEDEKSQHVDLTFFRTLHFTKLLGTSSSFLQ